MLTDICFKIHSAENLVYIMYTIHLSALTMNFGTKLLLIY